MTGIVEHAVEVVIDDVLGSQCTRDGNHMLLLAKDPKGNESEIAVATSALGKLISASALEAVNGQKAHGSKVPNGFNVARWNLGRESGPDGALTGFALLEFTLENGGRMGFLLNAFMQKGISDAFQVLTGSGTATPEGPVN
jgi:hypothetical protein